MLLSNEKGKIHLKNTAAHRKYDHFRGHFRKAALNIITITAAISAVMLDLINISRKSDISIPHFARPVYKVYSDKPFAVLSLSQQTFSVNKNTVQNLHGIFGLLQQISQTYFKRLCAVAFQSNFE